jgi:O-antigen ligase
VYPRSTMAYSPRLNAVDTGVCRRLRATLLIAMIGLPVIFQFSDMLSRSPSQGELFSPTQLFLGLVLLALLNYIVPSLPSLGRFGRIIYPLLAMCAYMTLEPLIGTYLNSTRNIVEAFRSLYPCAVYAAAYMLAKDKWISPEWLVNVGLAIVFITLGCQAASMVLGISKTIYGGEFNTAGFTDGASAVSQLLYCTLPVFLLAGRWRSKDILGLAMGLVAISLTMRRTALLATVAILLFGTCSRIASRRGTDGMRLLTIAFPCAVSIVFLCLLWYTPWGERLSQRFEDRTGSGRTDMFAAIIDHCSQRDIPATILGEGYGMSTKVLEVKIGANVYCHNDYLEIFFSIGLVGVLCLLDFIRRLACLAWTAVRQGSRYCDALFGCLGGVFVGAFFQGEHFQVCAAPAFAVFAMIAAAVEGEENT